MAVSIAQSILRWFQTHLPKKTGPFFNPVVIELDYPPSRDLRPRWGYSHPAHQGLVTLFNRDREEQLRLLRRVHDLSPWLAKINRDFSHDRPTEAGWCGGPMNAIDLALVYTFLAEYRPKRYVEIGSGLSTLFAARARQDHKLATEIISIDPEPRASIDAVCDRVLRKGLETFDLALFDQLEAGDIVFMDGSHRSFMNSDVTVFMMDVLPSLKNGVVIHFHDIHLPRDYPDMFVKWYWNEQYLLGVYLLTAGDRVKILMPSAHLSATTEMLDATVLMTTDWDHPTTTVATWHHGGSLWFTKA